MRQHGCYDGLANYSPVPTPITPRQLVLTNAPTCTFLSTLQ